MRPALLLAAAAALFLVLPQVGRAGAVSGTLLPVALAVAFAVVVAGRPSGTAIMAGALAAFAGSVVWSVAPSLAGGIVVGLGYAERTLRVRTVRTRALHLALALTSGAIAGALAASYAASPTALHGVALALCAVLSTTPLLVTADDARVALLESAAGRLGPPVSVALHEAAELLRCGDSALLDRETAAHVETSWRALDRLIEARLRIRVGVSSRSESARLVREMLDKQITEHVTSLIRGVTASRTVGAAEVGLDDTAFRDVDARGDVLDEQTRAMVEVRTR
jgi:hypothetical protein